MIHPLSGADTRVSRICRLTLATIGAALLSSTAFAAPAGPTVSRALVGGSMVDVENGQVISDAVIVITGNRIIAAGPAAKVTIPSDAQRIPMAGKWMLPGLINMHVHLGLKLPGAAGAALANENDAELGLRMAENARWSLMSGVTTVRLTGERHNVDFALKTSIDNGLMPGPRIQSAGEIIVPTGGHGTDQVDGPYGFAKAVREHVKAGATWIKIAVSGGISDSHGDIGAAPMTDEEIKTTVEVARRLNVKIAAHNGSPEAAAQIMKFGVDSFEHGYFFTEDTLKQMKAANTYLVPTIVVSQKGAMDFFAKIGSPPWYLARVKLVGEKHWAMLQMAIRMGVPIALGTDQFPYEPNEGTTATIREAELYVDAGMKPIDALRAGTLNAAKLLGMSGDVGSLSVGHYADVIAVDGDPTKDIHALRTIDFVMKDGRIVRSAPGQPAADTM
jgi:imidazolonepropionase-like amidohydrolase